MKDLIDDYRDANEEVRKVLLNILIENYKLDLITDEHYELRMKQINEIEDGEK